MLWIPAFLHLLALLAVPCSAALLLEGGTIISFNQTLQAHEILRDASLLIENDHITRLSQGSMRGNLTIDVEVINATDKIISPGFINTHQHLWQTAFKTIASNTTLGEYFQRYGEFGPAGKYHTAEDVYLGQLTGSLEMIHEGTTTVLDHAHGDFSNDTANAALNATFESGLRTFYAHAVHAIPNGYPVEDQVQLLKAFAKDPRFDEPDSRVYLGLAYDFFWNAPAQNISDLWEVTKENNLSVVTTHYLGGPWGSSNSPKLLEQHGWLNTSIPVVFSHGSFLDYDDAEILRNTNQYLSTTPESEQHFGHGHPNSPLIQDQASLGIDTHFTFSATMIEQARMWMQSLRERNFLQILNQNWQIPRNNPMSVSQAFSLITRQGALALRRDDLGVIREGAKADIVIFDGGSPNMLGWEDPMAAIILHSNTGDIEHVLIDGQFVKRNGRLVYNDYAGLQQRFLASARKIQQIWREEEWEQLNGLFEDMTPFGSTLVVDTERGDGTGY